MELYSGIPFWLIRNSLWDCHNPLTQNVRVPVAVIGSGITGALVAHHLCESGIECAVFDKRDISTGSSVASTALLQYEIDMAMCRMQDKIGLEHTVIAYRSCLQSIKDLARMIQKTGIEASFEKRPSLYLASDRKGEKMLREEAAIRGEFGLPGELLEHEDLTRRFAIDRPAALTNNASAQIDPHRTAVELLKYDKRHYSLPIYSHTAIIRWEEFPGHYVLETDRGYRIECEYVIIAAGFEAQPFLPPNKVKFTTTFALISDPVDPATLWPEKALIWETRRPYLYLRTFGDRMIAGGEDESITDPRIRERMAPGKIATVEKKVRRLFPELEFSTGWSWSGTFSSTPDALPIIGPTGDHPRMLFALGYGGNGITFSMIAAQMLVRKIKGIPDPREKVFTPDRESLQ